MRIIAGEFRGRALASVGKGDTGAHLRPTTDRVRESLFSMLTGGRFGDPITGSRVLDLFAGTGALGLEALSRGASHVTFVDDGGKARALIRQNVDICRAQGNTKIFRRDARKLGERQGPPFDLVFLDPPYGKSLGQVALATAKVGGWVTPGALIVWEEESPQSPPDGFTLLEHRRFGGTHVTLMNCG